MEATKGLLGILAAVTAIFVWTAANAAFWQWLVPHGGLERILYAWGTSIVLPGLFACVVHDLRAGGRAK